METGTVIYFNKDAGYGLIKPDVGTKNIFVHKEDIQTDGIQNLLENQRVKYVIEDKNSAGLVALNVSVPNDGSI